MRKLFPLILVLLGVMSMPCLAADENEVARAATVVELQPKVEFKPAAFEKKAFKPGTALYPGDQISTGTFGETAFVMADGSMVRLGSNTEILLKDAKLDAKGHNIFELAKGLLQAVVSKQGDGFFSVRTVHAVAAVKGTEWQIEEGPEHAEVKVLSGVVEVKNSSEADKGVLVQAGEATLSYKDRVAEVRKLSKGEIKELKKAFAAKVFKAKSDYADRIKKLKGN